MKAFLLGIIYALISIIVIATLGRLFISYLATIAIVDYIAFCGIAAIGIAYLSYDGSNPANQDMMSLITHRELVSREVDGEDQQSRMSFAFSVGISGVLLLVTSGFMAWLI